MSTADFLESLGDGLSSPFAPLGIVALGIVVLILAIWLHSSDVEDCQTACGSAAKGVLLKIDRSDSTCMCQLPDGSFHTP